MPLELRATANEKLPELAPFAHLLSVRARLQKNRPFPPATIYLFPSATFCAAPAENPESPRIQSAVRHRAGRENNYSNPPNAERSTFPARPRGGVPYIPPADLFSPAKENKLVYELRPASRFFLRLNFFAAFTHRI
jgi:hypothetical protein